MKTIKPSILIFCLFSINAFGQATFFEDTNSFLEKYVKDGSVAYSTLKKEEGELQKLNTLIEKTSLEMLSSNEKKAFYINAYNVLVIKSVVENYPLKSPLDVKGFFDEKKHLIAGEQLTLNQIENEKLRAVYNDARVHFVLVCAAKGCPKLMSYAYKPKHLDSLLDERTSNSLNDSYFIRINKKEEKLLVSEIFKWYRQDFIDHKGTVKDYILKYYLPKAQVKSYTLDYYAYDWELNSQ